MFSLEHGANVSVMKNGNAKEEEGVVFTVDFWRNQAVKQLAVLHVANLRTRVLLIENTNIPM